MIEHEVNMVSKALLIAAVVLCLAVVAEAQLDITNVTDRSGTFAEGDIDELRVYNVELTQAQVQQIMAYPE
jgi:hypothetical protein